jgi:hypothetical protein
MLRVSLLLSLLLSGCSLIDGDDADLDDARDRWEAAGVDDYTMSQTRPCFCPQEFTGPFEVRVSNGAITSVRFEGAAVPADRALTVEQVFDVIEEAYRERAEEVQVTYHPTLGYPTDLFIDYVEEVADDERGVQITDFEALP